MERSSRSFAGVPRDYFGWLAGSRRTCPLLFLFPLSSINRQIAMNDRASRALVESDLPGEPRTYDAISKRSRVPLTSRQERRGAVPALADYPGVHVQLPALGSPPKFPLTKTTSTAAYAAVAPNI